MITAYGNSYILVEGEDRNNWKALKGSPLVFDCYRGDCLLVYPREGDILDFSQAKNPVWVGGRRYRTVAHGWSSPANVKGKVIKITGVSAGNAYYFGTIKFEEIRRP